MMVDLRFNLKRLLIIQMYIALLPVTVVTMAVTKYRQCQLRRYHEKEGPHLDDPESLRYRVDELMSDDSPCSPEFEGKPGDKRKEYGKRLGEERETGDRVESSQTWVYRPSNRAKDQAAK